MTTGSILLTIALIIVLLLYLLRPFLTPATPTETRTPQQQLLTQKEQLLNQIHAIDFDHTTGKIPDDVYHPQRTHLIHQAALVAQQLDSQAANPADTETAIETAVAHLRHTPQPPTPSPTNGKPSRYCPQCGQPTDSNDKFCASCGHKLQEAIR